MCRSRRPAQGRSHFRGTFGPIPARVLSRRPTDACGGLLLLSERPPARLFVHCLRHGSPRLRRVRGRRRSRRRRGRPQTATARLELLDGGADGSPKSWRALADDLREVVSFRRRSADACAHALSAPDRRVRRFGSSLRASAGASFCPLPRTRVATASARARSGDARDVGAAGSKRRRRDLNCSTAAPTARRRSIE